MAYTFGYKLTNYTIKMIDFLYIYRGMTALQLSEMLYPAGYTASQEKSVYNHLRKLKKQGLVESLKLQQNVNPGSLYFLTVKGVDVAKESLNVIPGHYGHGFVKKHFKGNRKSLGDLSYDVYKPPLKQIAHHLMSIDFFIQLEGLSGVDHRIGLYAKKAFHPPLPLSSVKSVIRPDAEISIEEIGNYFVEFDRATEGHEQLRKKFSNYADYCEHLKDKEQPLPLGILFVVESKRMTYGMDRRWENVLSAFFEEMREFSDEVNLIMLTLDDVRETVLFEINRRENPSPYGGQFNEGLKNKGFSISSWVYKDEPIYTFAISEEEYWLFFINCIQARESLVYTRFAYFLNRLSTIKEKDEVKDLIFVYWKWVSVVTGGDPVFVKGLEKYEVPERLKEAFKTAGEIKKGMFKANA